MAAFRHLRGSRADIAIRRLSLLISLWVIALQLPVAALPAPQRIVKALAEGVRLIQEIDTSEKSPLVVCALKLDPRKAGVRVKAALGCDMVWRPDGDKGREAVSSLVSRRGCLAGINADFFDFASGDPLGLTIVDGELVSEPWPGRAAFGLTSDGKALFGYVSFSGAITTPSGQVRVIDGINRARNENELIVLTPTFGETTGPGKGTDPIEVVLSGLELPIRANRNIAASVESIAPTAENTPIPPDCVVLSASGSAAEWIRANLKTTEAVTLRFDLAASDGTSWANVVQAVGGGPMLLSNKKVVIDPEAEGFSRGFSTARHPRTAVGVTAAGELLLVTVDGRQTISRGVTLPELAAIMQRLGAVSAMNLDGGGSTTLSILGCVANSPSGGKERPVSSMLIIEAVPGSGSLRPAFIDKALETISGVPIRPRLLDLTTGLPVDRKTAEKVVWGTTGGIGLVSQEGRFIGIKAGTGKIVAISGNARAEIPVTVKPGPPAIIEAHLEQDVVPATNRNLVVVKLTDANGNPIPEYGFKLSVTGGVVDAPLGKTDANGLGSVGITWEHSSGGMLTIIVGSLRKQIPQPPAPREGPEAPPAIPIAPPAPAPAPAPG